MHRVYILATWKGLVGSTWGKFTEALFSYEATLYKVISHLKRNHLREDWLAALRHKYGNTPQSCQTALFQVTTFGDRMVLIEFKMHPLWDMAGWKQWYEFHYLGELLNGSYASVTEPTLLHYWQHWGTKMEIRFRVASQFFFKRRLLGHVGSEIWPVESSVTNFTTLVNF